MPYCLVISYALESIRNHFNHVILLFTEDDYISRSTTLGSRRVFRIHSEALLCLDQPARDPIDPLVAKHLEHGVVLRHLGHHFAELRLSTLPLSLICAIAREQV